MKKITESLLNLHKTRLVIYSHGLYLINNNTFIPINVLSLNLVLNMIRLNLKSSSAYFSGIFLLSRVWFTKKLKFRHKISWFYIKRRFYKFFFCQTGRSHIILCSLVSFIKRRKRYTANNLLIFYSLNWRLLNIYCFYFKNIQPINSYTLRGLRFSRQFIYKKQGKVSKYSGLKSKIF